MVHMQTSEVGTQKPRIRLWTDNQALYGQFHVVPFDDAEQIVILMGKYELGTITFHDCDNASDECGCKPLTYGETLAKRI